MIVDAKDLILGRMAAYVAKKALLGEKIDVVNCEKAVVTGNREFTFGQYHFKKNIGRNPYKGPFYPRMADTIVRRTIRGMLPFKKAKGREAYKRVMCWIGTPSQFKDKKMETIKEANLSKLTNNKYVAVGLISKQLGARE